MNVSQAMSWTPSCVSNMKKTIKINLNMLPRMIDMANFIKLCCEGPHYKAVVLIVIRNKMQSTTSNDHK